MGALASAALALLAGEDLVVVPVQVLPDGGRAVDVDGDTLATVEHLGPLFIFVERDAVWSLEGSFLPWPILVNGFHSVALHGDVVVAGEEFSPVCAGNHWVSVFERSGSVWVRTQLAAGNGHDDYGHALWAGPHPEGGTRILVGDPGANLTCQDGWGYELGKPGPWWNNVGILFKDQTQGWQTGWSIAGDGDTCVLGTGAAGDRAWVFERVGPGWNGWVEQTRLDDHAAVGSQFGVAVDVDGDTAVVGAPEHSGGGAVWVFRAPGSAWSTAAKEQVLVASDATAGDRFGSAVALQGDWLAVGAPEAGAGRGAAYVFERRGSSWTEAARVVVDSPAARFGFDVDVDADTLAVAARGARTTHIYRIEQ
jgi:hypothetical protein